MGKKLGGMFWSVGGDSAKGESRTVNDLEAAADECLGQVEGLFRGEEVLTFGGQERKARLRPYQALIAKTIKESVEAGKGQTFSVMVARQGGKNEISAWVEAYLLMKHGLPQAAHSRSARAGYEPAPTGIEAAAGGVIIKTAPTLSPQLAISKRRLTEILKKAGLWSLVRVEGDTVSLGNASAIFLSGQPDSNVMGHTASLLLEVDEAQDLDFEKFEKEFRPMVMATGATVVFYGTAWAPDSLLEKAKQRHVQLEWQDGIRRHFEYDYEAVGREFPGYAERALEQREVLGENNTIWLSQYRLLAQAGAGRMFSQEQSGRLKGVHGKWLGGTRPPVRREAGPSPAATRRRSTDAVDLPWGTYQVLVDADGREIVARTHLLSGQRSPEYDRPPLAEGRKCRVKRWHRHERWVDGGLSHKPCPQFMGLARKRIQPPGDEPGAGLRPATTGSSGQRFAAGLDIGGDASGGSGDPTVLTVARIVDAEPGQSIGSWFPLVEVVHLQSWQANWDVIMADLLELDKVFRFGLLAVDATGIGHHAGGSLERELGPSRVKRLTITAQTKSDLCYELRAAVDAGRVKVYREDDEHSRQLWRQVEQARLLHRPGSRLAGFDVPERVGHDDYLVSLALCVHAAYEARPRVAYGFTRDDRF